MEQTASAFFSKPDSIQAGKMKGNTEIPGYPAHMDGTVSLRGIMTPAVDVRPRIQGGINIGMLAMAGCAIIVGRKTK